MYFIIYIYTLLECFFYHTYNYKIRFVFNHFSILDICNFVVLLHQLLFSSPAIYYHLSLQCVIPPLQMYTKLHNKAIKLFTYVFKLQAPPIKRAHAQASALLWNWVIDCVLESIEFRILQLKTSLHPKRTSSLGSCLGLH